MKKISLVISSLVLIIVVTGGGVKAQTTPNQMPVRTSDPHPFVRKTPIVLQVKNSGGAAKTATAGRPLSVAELRAALPLKPGGSAGTSGGTGVGANKAIPVGRPGGQANSGQPTNEASGASKPPIKSASSGQVTPN